MAKKYAKGFDMIDWSKRGKTTPFKSRMTMAKRAPGITIISDIEPYKSVVTGEVIGGRRQHREHLKKHDLIEIGYERFPARKGPQMPNAGQDIKEAMERVAGGQKPEPIETYNP